MTLTLTGDLPDDTHRLLNAERQLIAALPGITVFNPVHNNSIIYYEHNARAWDRARADKLILHESIMQLCQSDCLVKISESKILNEVARLLTIPVFTSTDEAVEALSGGVVPEPVESIPEVPDHLWCEGCSVTGNKPAEQSRDNLVCEGIPIKCDLYRTYDEAAEGDPERSVVL